jgi:acetolactate synthase-like protein
MRHQRKEALKEADLVILAGTVCDFRLSYGRVLPRGVPIIAVNRDKDQLYRVMTDMFIGSTWLFHHIPYAPSVCGD